MMLPYGQDYPVSNLSITLQSIVNYTHVIMEYLFNNHLVLLPLAVTQVSL